MIKLWMIKFTCILSQLLLFIWILVYFSHLSFAQNQWRERERENDCVFYNTVSKSKNISVRVVCHWKVAPTQLQEILSSPDRYDEVFSGVSESVLVLKKSNLTRVFQVHSYTGITDRAAFMDYLDTPVPNGRRYSYHKARDQSVVPNRYVLIVQNTGFWEVTRIKSGSLLVFETLYEAGGSVPKFLIRWGQMSGIQNMIKELRAFVQKNKGQR